MQRRYQMLKYQRIPKFPKQKNVLHKDKARISVLQYALEQTISAEADFQAKNLQQTVHHLWYMISVFKLL